MPKFLIKDRQACWVTFRYVVEADTEEDAEQAWMDGDTGTVLDDEIGDCIDFLDGGTEIVPHKETTDAM